MSIDPKTCNMVYYLLMAVGITDAILDEIKQRVDLVDLVSSYGVSIHRMGNAVKACCPFHHEKTPSFHIDSTRGYFHCFGCSVSGDVITFVMKMDGLSFVDAVRKLAASCNIEIVERADPEAKKRHRLYDLMLSMARFYHNELLKSPDAAAARRYLESRALNGQPAEDFMIGYAPYGADKVIAHAKADGYTPEELETAGIISLPRQPGERPYHRFSNRVMFTIKDQRGRVVAFSGRQIIRRENSGKYVNSPETPIFKKRDVLFAFDKASGQIMRSVRHEAIVCEGQIDVIRLHISGFPFAVASQGTAFTEEQARMLKKVADSVYLVFDDDEAGHKATIRTAALLMAEGLPVKAVSLPNGEDPDSFLCKHSREEFQKLLDEAESIVNYQCRVAALAEPNPQSPDAVLRICRAVLQTIQSCSSPVLQATELNELATLLHLPLAAVNAEFSQMAKPVQAKAPATRTQVRSTEPVHPSSTPPSAERAPLASPSIQSRPVQLQPDPGQDAAKRVPPTPLEFNFMAFVKFHEAEAGFIALVRQWIPTAILSNPFTARFVEEICGADENETPVAERIATFSHTLANDELRYFDRILREEPAFAESQDDPADQFEEYVRRFWIAVLRHHLAQMGAQEGGVGRLEVVQDIKRIEQASWAIASQIIRSYIERNTVKWN